MPDGNTPVLDEQAMRALGFTDHREGHWHWHAAVDRDVTLNVTIDKSSGDYDELVMNERFGQPEYYGHMRPEFRDKIQAAIDGHLDRLNGAGLTIAVDPALYGAPLSPGAGSDD